jgi:hypothetical protein
MSQWPTLLMIFEMDIGRVMVSINFYNHMKVCGSECLNELRYYVHNPEVRAWTNEPLPPHHHIQIDSGAHPAPKQWLLWVPFLRVKWLEHDVYPLTSV